MTQNAVHKVAVGVLLVIGAGAIATYTYSAALARRGTKAYIATLKK